MLKRATSWVLPAAVMLAAASCGPPTPRVPDNDEPGPADSAPDPTLEARRAFANPGGMWTPAQLGDHADTLKKLGVEIEAKALTDPMAFPLGAVVWLGGCTASFVSADGLIITNHHCATGALQFNSSKKGANLMVDGYLAKTRADEKSNGPAAKVFVTQAFRDVTKDVRAGVADEKDDKKRYEIVEQRTKDLLAACEKDRPELRCSVVSYYGGEQYILIEQLEIRDVRLVHAPAGGIGKFGGEVDNWRWPRHTGDYSFFRAYVGPDGKPADFDVKNVPFKPKHHLRIATTPLKTNDFVMVAGYPGSTSRLSTAKGAAEVVDWYYPRRQKLCEEYVALLERLAKKDEELAIKGQRLLNGLNNVLTNTKGMLDGFSKAGLKDQKLTMEADLRKWISAHPDHADADKAIDNLAVHYAKYRGQREQDAVMWELRFMSMLIGAADSIVHMAEERPKPDAERHPKFQKRNHKRVQQGQKQGQRSYARELDIEKLGLALLRAARIPKAQRPKIVEVIVGKGEPTAEAIAKALTPLYEKTELESADKRIELLQKASTADLKASKDPFIKLALKLRPLFQASEDRAEGYTGAKLIDAPRYIAALRASKNGILAPDANSTLRITYGTVRGYKPKPDAETYYPFTKLSGMVAKATGKEPFNAPANLLAAAKKGAGGEFVQQEMGEVPVDFLSDLDITGGNSGSPTLNARGELVGLAFDGNYEAMASDWLFMPDITRSIHVDIRYVLWIMKHVDGAGHLLAEMGVK
jgi:hypothetical protein